MRIFVTTVFIFIPAFCFAAYVAPIGVPDPPTNQTSSHTTLYGSGSDATYDYEDDDDSGGINWSGTPQGAVSYRIGSDGPYTHYIDQDDVGCTDTNNPHGTESTPRCTLPDKFNLNTLLAGSVIEMHNDNSTQCINSGEVHVGINGSGTSGAPIFFRGPTDGKVRHCGDESYPTYTIQGDYQVWENINFDRNESGSVALRFGTVGVGTTHTTIRDCTFTDSEKNPSGSQQMIRAKISNDELMPNSEDQTFALASAWIDVDLTSGGGSYDETDDLSLTAGGLGSGDYCTLPVASFPTDIGKDYRITMMVDNLTGTWTVKSYDGTQTIGTISTDGRGVIFDWTATTTGGLRIVAAANDAVVDLDLFTLSELPDARNQYIIIYDNDFTYLGSGDPTGTRSEASKDRDVVGLSIDSNAIYVWFVGNTANYVGGDMIQVAYDSYAHAQFIPANVYIGLNTASNMYENMVDLKLCENIIISQNTAYNFGDDYSSLSKGGNGPFRYGLGEGPSGINKNNIWSIFNIAYNMDPEGSHCVFNLFDYAADAAANWGPRYAEDVYFIGNIIYNYGTSADDGFGFCFGQALSVYFYNNTAYDGDTGFYFTGDIADWYPSEEVIIENNVIENADVNLFYIRATDGSWANWTMQYNKFYDSVNGESYKIADYPDGGGGPSWTTYSGVTALVDFCADFDGTPHPQFCTGTTEENPEFANAPTNLSPDSGSPLFDSGSNTNRQIAEAAFFSRYGVSIAVDYTSTGAPVNVTYNIGAYESTEAGPETARGVVIN